MTFHIPILLAAVLSLTYILTDRFSRHSEKYHQHFLSLGSGMLVALIFIEVFRSLFTEGAQYIGNLAYFGVLGGFTAYHAFEKYIYRHSGSREDLIKNIGNLHVFGFMMDNFIDGFILVLLFGLAASTNLLLFILFLPLLLTTIATAVSLRHINDKFEFGGLWSILLPATFIIGSVVGTILTIDKTHFFVFLSVLSGVFIYFIVRDEIPTGKRGRPLFFIIGAVVVSGILLFVG